VVATIRPPVEFIPVADETAEIQASRESVLFLDIPDRRYLAVEGDAPPGSESFKRAIATLYPIAYALHFALRARGIQAPVGHLHGIYWIGDGEERPLPQELAESSTPDVPMRWRLLIGLPDAADPAEIEAAIAHQRGRPTSTGIEPAVVRWREGQVAQILHVGPYNAEAPTVARLRAAIREAGLVPTAGHHEIYLSGPRTAADRMRTVIRQAVNG